MWAQLHVVPSMSHVMPSDYREEKGRRLHFSLWALMPECSVSLLSVSFPINSSEITLLLLCLPHLSPQQGHWGHCRSLSIDQRNKIFSCLDQGPPVLPVSSTEEWGMKAIGGNLLLSILLYNNGNQVLIPERSACSWCASHAMFSGLVVTTSIRWLS